MKKEVFPRQIILGLKIFRKLMAHKRAIDPEAVLDNITLEKLANQKPKTIEELRPISSGKDKLLEYAVDILSIITFPFSVFAMQKRETGSRRNGSVQSKLMSTKFILQKRATSAEIIFQKYLNELGIPYRFQKGLMTPTGEKDFRVLDFYIPRARVVFEIDGRYHENKHQKLKDEKRTNEIQDKRNILIFRFTNEEVINRAEFVKEKIKDIFEWRYKPKRARILISKNNATLKRKNINRKDADEDLELFEDD